MEEYTKKPLSFEEQIKHLKSKGLSFVNEVKALHTLQHVSYFRLKSYLQPAMYDRLTHTYKPGATFEQAYDLYKFDSKLRKLVMTEVEKIAIIIVPYATQPSNWVQCEIYTITNNKWIEQKSFGIALWDECGGKESLDKCLIKKNGRWMYAEQFDIDMEPKENPYQYVFD